jgi:uncharacterized membrane protein
MRALPRLEPERIEALTDLVFGLALGLSAIQLTLHPPASDADVLTNVLEFAVSFSVLIWTWSAYSRLVARLRVESSRMLSLNAGLLLVVGIEPYLLHVLWINILQTVDVDVLRLSSVAYAVDLALMVGILGWMTHCVAADRSLALSRARATALDRLAIYRGVIGVLFGVTVLGVFWDVSVSVGTTTNALYPVVIRARYLAWIALFLLLVFPFVGRTEEGPADPDESDRPGGSREERAGTPGVEPS